MQNTGIGRGADPAGKQQRRTSFMDRKHFLSIVCGGTASVACGAIPCCGIAAPAARTEDPGKADLLERAKFSDAWVKRLMAVVDSQMGLRSREKLMESNGRACYAAQHGQRPDKISTDALDQLISRLKKWTGEEGLRREKEVIRFTYGPGGAGEKRCLCPLVANIPSGLSATYCHCSVGYVTEMFERATGKPAKVTLTESLKRGGKACRFLIQV
jgi:hypothetical protein